MRLAILADIHGNHLALEAVLADMAARGADAIVDLGDCVSGPLWPRDTLARLRTLGATTLRGNHDRHVGEDRPEGLSRTDAFAHADLDAEGRRWLAHLPARFRLGRIEALHASPEADDVYLLEDVVDGRLVPASPATVARRLDAASPCPGGVAPGLILCGHSHQPTLRRLPDGRWIVNPGSVGCPAYDDPGPPAHVSESGSPAARYAILDLDPANPGDSLRAAFHAVPYDHAAAAARARACDRPDWAHALSTGYANAS